MLALHAHRGLLLSGSADSSVRLWSLEEGRCVATLGHPSLGQRAFARDKGAVQSLATTEAETLATVPSRHRYAADAPPLHHRSATVALP